MREVTFMSHRGFDCAVPSHQVISARTLPVADAGEDTGIVLWPNEEEGLDPDRVLQVVTREGNRQLFCSNVRLGGVERGKISPLPPTLRNALKLPHVVGVAMRDDIDMVVWLVDLNRFAP